MTQAPVSRPSLLRYWSPRYWPTWLLLLWFVLAAQLPFRVNMRLHRLLGRLAGSLVGCRARIARCNLEICFPERSPAEIESLLRRHFEAMGAFVGETAFAWFASVPRLHRLLEIEGAEHLEAALARGKGALLFTGHFTGLEITGPLLSAVTDRFTFMFSRRRNGLLDELQRRRRERVAARSFEKEQVRALLRSLKDNCVVWYAADQYYRGSHAGLVRFFHEPAMTNTAVSRIAALSGAPVVPFFYRRREDDSGYILSFEAPIEGLPSGDAAADTRQLVRRLEAAVRRCPEQYWWSHKRFRNRPAPLPDLYAAPPRGSESSPPAGEPAQRAG